jgi:hypothetical protein
MCDISRVEEDANAKGGLLWCVRECARGCSSRGGCKHTNMTGCEPRQGVVCIGRIAGSKCKWWVSRVAEVKHHIS